MASKSPAISDFQCKVYFLLTKAVPAGRVTTYGAIAKALGGSSSQAVGTALSKNPYAPHVPCR